MSHLYRADLGAHSALLNRARALRLRAADALDRAVHLRRRSHLLLSTSVQPDATGTAPVHPGSPGADADDVETRSWFRVRVKEMLSEGWTRAELRDIGVTDALLRELGLRWPAPA